MVIPPQWEYHGDSPTISVGDCYITKATMKCTLLEYPIKKKNKLSISTLCKKHNR